MRWHGLSKLCRWYSRPGRIPRFPIHVYVYDIHSSTTTCIAATGVTHQDASGAIVIPSRQTIAVDPVAGNGIGRKK
jgi:hypothetical protein